MRSVAEYAFATLSDAELDQVFGADDGDVNQTTCPDGTVGPTICCSIKSGCSCDNE
jgi:hypothetical protein